MCKKSKSPPFLYYVLACEFLLACFCIHISKLSWWMSTITELLIPQQETGGLSSRLKVWFDQKSEQERTVVIIYLSVLRINAQTNSCFIEFVKSSYFYIINQPNLCLRLWSSNYTWNFLHWFVMKNNIENLGFELSTWNCGQIYLFGTGQGPANLETGTHWREFTP